MERRVGNKFRVGRKIGSGSFGEIYLGCSVFLSLMILFGFLLFLCFLFYWSCWCFLFWIAGTNIVTNEDIAIKLVSDVD